MKGEDLQEFTVKYYEDQLIKGIENFHPGGIDYTEKLAMEVGVQEGARILDVASGSGHKEVISVVSPPPLCGAVS